VHAEIMWRADAATEPRTVLCTNLIAAAPYDSLDSTRLESRCTSTSARARNWFETANRHGDHAGAAKALEQLAR
jgi:hypothetical protein